MPCMSSKLIGRGRVVRERERLGREAQARVRAMSDSEIMSVSPPTGAHPSDAQAYAEVAIEKRRRGLL